MNKALLSAGIIAVILLVAMVLWPVAGQQGRSPQASLPGIPVAAGAAHAEPYATAEAFHAAWQAYLRGESADAARITVTAAGHRDWVDAIFPENVNDFNDGLRLNLGKYRILYPYLSGALIDEYDILLTEVSNNSPEMVNILIKSGANPNRELILTAANSPLMIDVLIRAGTDPNRPRLNGSSPLDYFKHLGRPELIDAMIRNGAR